MKNINLQNLKNSRIFNSSFIFIAGAIAAAVILISLVFSSNIPQGAYEPRKQEYIYNTWRIESFYKSGKLDMNNPYRDVVFIVNRDGSVQWYTPEKTITTNFRMNSDLSQIVFYDGITQENVNTIYELRKNKLRFGRRNVIDHYEYVMVPEQFE